MCTEKSGRICLHVHVAIGTTAGDFHLYLCVSSRGSTFVDLLAVEPLNPIPDLGEPMAERISVRAKPHLPLTLSRERGCPWHYRIRSSLPGGDPTKRCQQHRPSLRRDDQKHLQTLPAVPEGTTLHPGDHGPGHTVFWVASSMYTSPPHNH